MSKPKLNEVEVIDPQDAKVPFKYIVTRDHVWGSVSKHANPFGHCVQENSINNMPGVLGCRYYKTVAYIRFKGNPHVAVRYIPSQDGKIVAEINDKKGKKELLKMLKKPMELWLEVPRWNRSLKYSRSEEMKVIRKESKERCGDGLGRSYDKPSKRGFRDGTGIGLAHMWKAKGK